MKYTRIAFKNIGPIEAGEIEHKKVSVLFGNNNSGKSIASSLIHGICQLDTAALRNLARSDMFKDERINGDQQSADRYIYGQKILWSAGIPQDRIATFNKRSCTLEIHSPRKTALSINFKRPRLSVGRSKTLARFGRTLNEQSDVSIYVPAGRTGVMQYYISISRAKNTLLRYTLDAFLETVGGSDKRSKKDAQLTNIPEHPERMYDLIIREGSLNQDVKDIFSTLFPGSIKMDTSNAIPKIVYVDPSGFETEIEHAGSGIASSLPIVMSLQYVDDGGTLVIEEPEAHLEPARQMRLIEDLVAAADNRKIDLVFSTQSDYVVKKLLAMTVSKKIERQDLGFYYFKRMPNAFTRITKFVADKDGEIPQAMFDDALDSLVEEFSS